MGRLFAGVDDHQAEVGGPAHLWKVHVSAGGGNPQCCCKPPLGLHNVHRDFYMFNFHRILKKN